MEKIYGVSNWQLTIRRAEDHVEILRAVTCDAKAILPDTLFDLPVTVLGSYALSPMAKPIVGEEIHVSSGGDGEWSNRTLQELTLPSTLTEVQRDIWDAFESSLQFTSLILFIPYIVSITAFTLQDRNRRLREIEDDYDKAMQERLATTRGLISFYDERGELQLSVTKDNLLYIESADNYIYIWYMKGNLPKKLMLRNTLKRTAELLVDTNVMRCHRGYMVNMEQVKVLRREKENFYLELGIEGVKDIPVSKTYGETVLKWLSM